MFLSGEQKNGVRWDGSVAFTDKSKQAFCAALCEEDVSSVAALYRLVKITRDTAPDFFDQSSPNSFSKHGGMFNICD